MKTPTEFQLAHLGQLYDPVKAHEYYVRNRHLKGRKKGEQPPSTKGQRNGAQTTTLHRRAKGTLSPKAQQKIELQRHVAALTNKLNELEQLIKKKEAVLEKDQLLAKSKANQNQKGKAKGPKTAAQKVDANRKSKQYRQAHKQQLANKAKAKGKSGKSGHGSGSKSAGKKTPDSQKSIVQLKTLATKVRGLLAVAQHKLAAL